MKVGINGFGRIGRAATRIIAERSDMQVVAVNELDDDLENFVYLLKYDSMYGRCRKPVTVDLAARRLSLDGRPISFFSEGDITAVPWESLDVDVVIEATGVTSNVLGARTLVESGRVRKVAVTNAHPAVDTTIIIGVNDETYDPSRHHVVSTSICDANAIAPVLHHLHRRWGVEAAQVTTLHPWLSYQNLLDGPVSSISSPGHTWRDYGLGRASVVNLIPKDTTAAKATLAVLPELAGRLEAISFRVPTHLVSASDVCIQLASDATVDEVNQCFAEIAAARRDVMSVETEQLVSSDFIGMSQSCIIAARQTRVVGRRLLKMVTWYDNEWAYSCRAVDVAMLIVRPV